MDKETSFLISVVSLAKREYFSNETEVRKKNMFNKETEKHLERLLEQDED